MPTNATPAAEVSAMPTYRAMPASKVLGLPLVSVVLVSVVG